MIQVLIVLLILLIVITWAYSMFVAWKATEGLPVALIELGPLINKWRKGTRLTRRGWYTANRKTKDAIYWTRDKASSIFIKIMPKSAPLFAKRDPLSGLNHGPSSYFLKKISQPQNPIFKRLPKRKKML